jgi:serine/threonine-protein kinase
MSSIVFCEDSTLQRHVAVKFLHDATHGRRIRDELLALLKLRSKHVVQIYDICQFPDDCIGIIQEFVDGPDLFESFATPESTDAYYKQLWQIAAGISDIHAENVIHRDIKPNNMKIDPEGVIKIFDFGLARDAGLAAATVGFVGTPGFAAPELYAVTARFTAAIDVYAFGVTALFLATGTLPTELTAHPPQPSPAGYFRTIGLGLGTEVIELLEACLAPLPAKRPPMSAVRDALARHLLFGKHQALVVFNGQATYLNSVKRNIVLNLPSVGRIEISYDGLNFCVTAAMGEVFINNSSVSTGQLLPGCCVVALGSQARHNSERAFITFDLSHPEIVL